MAEKKVWRMGTSTTARRPESTPRNIGAGPAAQQIGELLQRGLAAHQGGELDQAEDCYRRALDADPTNANALHLHGLLNYHRGDNQAAIELIGRSLEGKPDNPPARNHLAAALGQLGRHGEAVELLEGMIAAGHDRPDVHANLGIALEGLGRLDDAEAALSAALAAKPGYPPALNTLALLRLRQGRPEDAIGLFEQAVGSAPDDAAVLGNLGNALAASGRTDDAQAALERASEMAPEASAPHVNLADLYAEIGRPTDAFNHCLTAIRLEPSSAVPWIALEKLLRENHPDEYSDILEKAVLGCFSTRYVDDLEIAGAVGRLIELKYADFSVSFDDAASMDLALADRIAADDLVQAYLTHCVNQNLALEILLRAVRRFLLLTVEPPKLTDPQRMRLLSSLAQQAWANEFLWPLDEQESAALETLRQGLDADFSGADPALTRNVQARLALHACYAPLTELAAADALGQLTADHWSKPLAVLARRYFDEPATQAAIAEALPSLAPLNEETSVRVADMYGENPYPRWLSLPEAMAEPAAARPSRLFPYFAWTGAPTPGGADGPVEILVAGCGTGRHPIGLAKSSPDANILAIDLSRASLGYAAYMADALEAPNVEFQHGDLLDISKLGRRFHIAEAVGVLHHMDNPAAGLDALVDIVTPGGLMVLGLYSEAARASIVAMREWIAAQGFDQSPAALPTTIRAVRRALMTDPALAPYDDLAAWPDFHAMSGVRDMLFHVQEHRFTLPRVDALIEAAGLDFVGMQTRSAAMRRAYRARFPIASEPETLERWGVIEADDPDMFAGMYVFWCQKPA